MTAEFPQKSAMTIALVAMAIAVLLPFDRGLQAITDGVHGLHVLLIGAMVPAGCWFARRAGLGLGGNVWIGLGWALAAAVYVLVIDIVLARPLLAADIVVLAHTPLLGRLSVFMMRAFNENVIYRLFAFSALMALWRAASHGRALPLGVVVAGAFAVQLVNIGINVVLPGGHAFSALQLAYWLVRYVLPGALWGYLFWRRGFVTAEVASVAGHIFLQPAFGLLV